MTSQKLQRVKLRPDVERVTGPEECLRLSVIQPGYWGSEPSRGFMEGWLDGRNGPPTRVSELGTREVHLRGCELTPSRYGGQPPPVVSSLVNDVDKPSPRIEREGWPASRSLAHDSGERRLVSRVGIEPTTRRLRVCCSAN
jgi:hypothetical protein